MDFQQREIFKLPFRSFSEFWLKAIYLIGISTLSSLLEKLKSLFNLADHILFFYHFQSFPRHHAKPADWKWRKLKVSSAPWKALSQSPAALKKYVKTRWTFNPQAQVSQGNSDNFSPNTSGSHKYRCRLCAVRNNSLLLLALFVHGNLIWNINT